MKLNLTIKTSVQFSMLNRKYASEKIDSKNVTFTSNLVNVEMPYDMVKIKSIVDGLYNQLLSDVIVVANDDPYLIHLLEPKNGNTVHNRLNEIRAMPANTYAILGTTIPSEVINGYRLLVVGSAFSATLEGVLAVLALEKKLYDARIPWISSISATDETTGITASITGLDE